MRWNLGLLGARLTPGELEQPVEANFLFPSYPKDIWKIVGLVNGTSGFEDRIPGFFRHPSALNFGSGKYPKNR